MQKGQLHFFSGGTEKELKLLLNQVEKTESIAERTKGLLGREELNSDQALWITPCNSVHTFGMKVFLDILYINRQGIIKKVISELAPRRCSFSISAHSAIELKSGMIASNHIRIGDRIEWIETSL